MSRARDRTGDRDAAARAAGRSRLAALIRERCFIRGSFRLAGGGTSDVYFDCKRITLDPEGILLVSDLMLDLVADLRRDGVRIDAVGGPSVGADPIAAGMALRSFQRGAPIPAFLVRGAAKDHGTGRLIENDIPMGAAVLVVEDVVTSGRSVRAAIDRVLSAGLKVAALACIVDREQGGREALSPHRFESLYTRSDFEPPGS